MQSGQVGIVKHDIQPTSQPKKQLINKNQLINIYGPTLPPPTQLQRIYTEPSIPIKYKKINEIAYYFIKWSEA